MYSPPGIAIKIHTASVVEPRPVVNPVIAFDLAVKFLIVNAVNLLLIALMFMLYLLKPKSSFKKRWID